MKPLKKIVTGHGDDHAAGCLLDYACFKYYCKMIPIDLSNQKELDADHRAIKQFNFTVNLDKGGNTRINFILEEARETVLDFSQGTVKVLSAVNAIPLSGLSFISIKWHNTTV